MTASAYRWRQPRLMRGWQPVQMVGKMKILAARAGVELPPTWLLLRLVFLWENHRAAIPLAYDRLLGTVFDTYVSPRPRGQGHP